MSTAPYRREGSLSPDWTSLPRLHRAFNHPEEWVDFRRGKFPREQKSGPVSRLQFFLEVFPLELELAPGHGKPRPSACSPALQFGSVESVPATFGFIAHGR